MDKKEHRLDHQQNILISNAELSVIITPLFGAIYNIWDKYEEPLLWHPPPKKNAKTPAGGCFPLIPYTNRIKNGVFKLKGKEYKVADNNCGQPHALHGNGWTNEWDIIKKESSFVILKIQSYFYPFHYIAEQKIELLENCISINMKITHLGDAPIPYGVGFHPWFIKDKDTELYAPASHIWHEDQQHFPTKMGAIPLNLDFSNRNRLPSCPLNNLFTKWKTNNKNQPYAEIHYPNKNQTINIEASAFLNQYMLYQNGTDFFCFEPVSHNINAHNNKHMQGLKQLAKNQTLTASLKMTFNRI